MSTAVLISGQMRTFAQCYLTQRWQIFRHYEPDIHFFVSCVDDAQSSSSELLKEHYQNVHIDKYVDPVLPEIPIEKGAHAPYANAATHKALLLQHWGNKRVWDFFRSRRGETQFDTIIRIRPDQWIHRFQPPEFKSREIAKYENASIYSDISQVFCPWWGKFGGVNDRLAVMTPEAANHYFGMFDNIAKLLDAGCPFHPETLVKECLILGGVEIHNTLMAEMSTQRLDGTRRWPETSASDLAELTYELSLLDALFKFGGKGIFGMDWN